MQADVTALPLLYEPAAQLPDTDTAARPVRAQYIPWGAGRGCCETCRGAEVACGHGVAACMAGCGQKLPEGQAVQFGEAALPED